MRVPRSARGGSEGNIKIKTNTSAIDPITKEFKGKLCFEVPKIDGQNQVFMKEDWSTLVGKTSART